MSSDTPKGVHEHDEKSKFVFKDKHADKGGGTPEAAWFPHQFEYQGKTLVTSEQAEKLPKLRWLIKKHEDDIIHSEELLSLITEYEATSPSIHGESRTQQMAVLTQGRIGEAIEGVDRYLGLIRPDKDND